MKRKNITMSLKEVEARQKKILRLFYTKGLAELMYHRMDTLDLVLISKHEALSGTKFIKG